MRINKTPAQSLILMAGSLFLLLVPVPASTLAPPDAAMRQAVEDDWIRQERRWGRAADSIEALTAAASRADALLKRESRTWPAPRRLAMGNEWSDLQRQATRAPSLQASEREVLYRRIRWFARNLALQNPQISGQPLLFMTRNRFICQMLHEWEAPFPLLVPLGNALHRRLGAGGNGT